MGQRSHRLCRWDDCRRQRSSCASMPPVQAGCRAPRRSARRSHAGSSGLAPAPRCGGGHHACQTETLGSSRRNAVQSPDRRRRPVLLSCGELRGQVRPLLPDRAGRAEEILGIHAAEAVWNTNKSFRLAKHLSTSKSTTVPAAGLGCVWCVCCGPIPCSVRQPRRGLRVCGRVSGCWSGRP